MKEKIAALLFKLNANLDKPILDRTDTEIYEYVEKITAKAKIISISNEGRLEAFIAFYDNDAEKKIANVSLLAVSFEALGMGYGKILMQAALDVVLKQGFTFFDVVGNMGSKRSVDFVLDFGFKETVVDGTIFYRKEL